MNAPQELEKIADAMRCGDYTMPTEMVVLTRDIATDTITIHRYGEATGLLQAVAMFKRGNA